MPRSCTIVGARSAKTGAAAVPPKRLILKMYDLQAQLGDVNQRIMSGRSVPEAEWEKLRRLSMRMGDIFDQVSFAWRPNEMSALSFAENQVEVLLEEEER